MANLFYNMLVFGISLQLGAYVLWAFNFFNGYIVYPFGTYSQMMDLSNMFGLSWWSALIGVTGVFIGLMALLLRQGTYAIFAVLLFAIGVFFKPVSSFVLVIPNTIAALLPLSSNPIPGSPNPLETVVGIIVVFAAFIFIGEMALQRKVS